jgi:NAD(P)-dependent dehydrogenase (short-subunit alcohol dehydrogenase family)
MRGRQADMTSQRRDEVVVIIGSGAMGLAAARRLGPGRRLLLADYSANRLGSAADSLAADGHDVDTMTVDVRDARDVAAVAAASGEAGMIKAVVHTAGVAPSQGSARDVLAVNLVGSAHVIDRFLERASPGTSLVCVASMAGHRRPLDPALEGRLAVTPADRLLEATGLDLDSADPRLAYDVAKRGVQLRVAAAAGAWGSRGARINSISPGIIATPMSREALAGQGGAGLRASLGALAVPRLGTPDDIAAAVEFLCSPAAGYITGTDLLIDGGATALRHWGAGPEG